MTLQQFAYLGEIIAAIAVVASLIYVARQLGQNTAMMQVNAVQAWIELNFQLAGPIAAHRELQSVGRKVLETSRVWMTSINNV